MKLKLQTMLAIVLVLALALTSCGTSAPSATTAPTEAAAPTEAVTPTEAVSALTRTVNDTYGEVAVYDEATRIASTAPAFTTGVIMAGALDKLVGIDNNTLDNAWLLSKLPALADIPMICQSGQMEMETLLVHEPDLVLLAPTYKDAFLEPLTALNIPCVSTPALGEMSLMEQAKARQLYYCEVIGGLSADKGSQFEAYFDAMYERVHKVTGQIPDEEKPRVIEVYSLDPLTVINGNDRSMAQEWITLGGGVNCAGDNKDDATSGRLEVSMEQVAQWDPEYVICYSSEVMEGILADEAWANISAVKNDRVLAMPSGTMLWGYNGPDIVMMMGYTAKLLHPDLFADIDIWQDAIDFYGTYFGIELTEEDFGSMFRTELPREEYFNRYFTAGE